MQSLKTQRCFHHPGREAAARCPECERFFCRECVTEHDGRVTCANCLEKSETDKPIEKNFLGTAVRLAQCSLCFVFLWLIFYDVGQIVFSIPGTYHEGII